MESALEELWLSNFQAWVGVTGGRSGRLVDRKRPVTWKRGRALGQTTKPPSPVMTVRSEARERKSDNGREIEREKPSYVPQLPQHRAGGRVCKGKLPLVFEESSTLRPSLLPENYHDLCPNFNLLMAMRRAHNSRIPKMVQAIFYTMVLNDDAELGLSSRIAMDCMMSALRELNAQPPKNQFRELKKIPYTVPIFEPGIPSWSSCEYSSTPSILNIEEEVSYPWEINIAAPGLTDVQERRMAKPQSTPRIRTPDELLAEGTTEGNLWPTAEVMPTSTSSLRDGALTSSSSNEASTSSSLDGASTSSSSRGASSSLRRVVPRKRDRAQVEPVFEVVTGGTVFPRAPVHSNREDGSSTYFPNPNVVPSLKRTALEKKRLLPAGYRCVILEADAIVNRPPPNG
ncbi:hypothetical protein Cgig2_012719 [Carnegiea gigantea]|uniref:Uncharacterized protein n=1 Tax=Carnegiea gigantea TaxID=171969 RepID=A0A9Q1GHE7_9CARY|nr:hypothetical protein Cgig2_012719 [Carnegiea gigantea]